MVMLPRPRAWSSRSPRRPCRTHQGAARASRVDAPLPEIRVNIRQLMDRIRAGTNPFFAFSWGAAVVAFDRWDSSGACGGLRDALADGQVTGIAWRGLAGVLRLPDQYRSLGGDEQQDQIHEPASLWVQGSGVLQAQNPGDPPGQVRFSRMSHNS